MGELFYYDEKWIRYDNKVYSLKYRGKLSEIYEKRFPFYKLSSSMLIERANEAKISKKYDISISCFEILLLKTSPCETINFVSELSSLYRKCKRPNAVIELYKYLINVQKINNFPSSFLTSLAAAYLDIGKKDQALKYAGVAYHNLGGNKDKELENVYLRINSFRD